MGWPWSCQVQFNTEIYINPPGIYQVYYTVFQSSLQCRFFSYIPDIYVQKEGDLTDKEKIEINNLNSELVHKLKAQDTAFSTGDKILSMLVSLNSLNIP